MSVVAQCSDLANGNAMIQTSVIANLAFFLYDSIKISSKSRIIKNLYNLLNKFIRIVYHINPKNSFHHIQEEFSQLVKILLGYDKKNSLDQ